MPARAVRLPPIPRGSVSYRRCGHRYGVSAGGRGVVTGRAAGIASRSAALRHGSARSRPGLAGPSPQTAGVSLWPARRRRAPDHPYGRPADGRTSNRLGTRLAPRQKLPAPGWPRWILVWRLGWLGQRRRWRVGRLAIRPTACAACTARTARTAWIGRSAWIRHCRSGRCCHRRHYRCGISRGACGAIQAADTRISSGICFAGDGRLRATAAAVRVRPSSSTANCSASTASTPKTTRG